MLDNNIIKYVLINTVSHIPGTLSQVLSMIHWLMMLLLDYCNSISWLHHRWHWMQAASQNAPVAMHEQIEVLSQPEPRLPHLLGRHQCAADPSSSQSLPFSLGILVWKNILMLVTFLPECRTKTIHGQLRRHVCVWKGSVKSVSMIVCAWIKITPDYLLLNAVGLDNFSEFHPESSTVLHSIMQNSHFHHATENWLTLLPKNPKTL